MTNQYHEIFTIRCQPHLLKQTFHPTPQQLQIGKQSLIQKSKIQNGYQQFLFCKKQNDLGQQFLTNNQKSLIQTYKKKYIDYIKVNYNEKIVEELYNISKLKNKIRQFQNKNKEEIIKKLQENVRQKQYQLEDKKRKKESKAVGGKKKVKVNVAEEVQIKVIGKKGKGKNLQAKEGEKVVIGQKTKKQVEIEADQDDQQGLQSQSLQMDLLNSLSMQQFQDNQ